MTNPALSGRGKSLKRIAPARPCSSAHELRLTWIKAAGASAGRQAVAIVDIGSNSVRLVAYEGLTRAPTPIFNEKAHVRPRQGRGDHRRAWPRMAWRKALEGLRRFRALCEIMEIDDVASDRHRRRARRREWRGNFSPRRRRRSAATIELLSGVREAELSALGVDFGHAQRRWRGRRSRRRLAGADRRQDGEAQLGEGVTLPLGGLALMDASGRSPKTALRIARQALGQRAVRSKVCAGRTFYAVGGTWRSLAKLHMRQCNYPLEVMHDYVIPARDAADFAALVERVDTDALVADRGDFGGAPSAAGLWRGRARGDHSARQAARDGDLRRRRARRLALRAA